MIWQENSTFSRLFYAKLYVAVTLNAIKIGHSHHLAMFELVLFRDLLLLRLDNSERT